MADISSHSKIKVQELHHTWKIEHYSFCHMKGKRLRSMVFPNITAKADCKWYLYLTPSNETDGKRYMGLYLKLYPFSKCKKVYGRYRFSILDDRQRMQYSSPWKMSKFEVCDGKPSKGHGFSKFISKDDLFSGSLLLNDRLTIYCELSFSIVHVFTETTDLHCSSVEPIHHHCTHTLFDLSEDLKQLFENRECTDVVLSASGREFPAHKCILMARSPVFAAMFKHNLKEKEHNRVDITDIDDTVLEEMLRYVYSGKCKNLESKANGLLAAAEKYNLEGLKSLCNQALIRNLTAENAADMLALAHMHCASDLKSKAMAFIVANSVAVMESNNWKTIAPSFPQALIMEVCQALSHRLNTVHFAS